MEPDRTLKISRDIDVAINIFAKPWQTALSVLSLHQHCGRHINAFWLQFEPLGSKFDSIPPYLIVPYMTQELGIPTHAWQPETWQARKPASQAQLTDGDFRRQLRYGNAFENSKTPFLFLAHNDIFVQKDLLGILKNEIGDAFAIGQLGQCWNCPASSREIMEQVMGKGVCGPENYMNIQPTFEQLEQLYKKAREVNFPARPYEKNGFSDEFRNQPWPLPECRINEWACLINMKLVRPLSLPQGSAWPPGAYRDCGGHNLDVVTPFFRDLHAQGLRAKHFNVKSCLKHWVGTGNKSRERYSFSEERARQLIKEFYPDYLKWVNRRLIRQKSS